MKNILFILHLIIFLVLAPFYVFAQAPQSIIHNMHIAPGNVRGPGLTGDGCQICHIGDDEPIDPDEVPIDPDASCATCHSPNGSYDGLHDVNYGAWPNRGVGIYQADGNLQPGKEKWCISCHDNVPAYSKHNLSDPDGVYAPNIAGDDTTFGFFINGHRSRNCLNCHDSNVSHIDDEHRTYAFDSDYYEPDQSGIAYAEGYRLRYIDGEVPLMIPGDSWDTFGWDGMLIKDTAFRLCFSCHNASKIFDNDDSDGVIDTNFKTASPDPPGSYSFYWAEGYENNEHVAHLIQYTGKSWDSDWDTATSYGVDGCDSIMTCSSCHNVHGAEAAAGSTNECMIRDGSLAGRAGYGFSYVVEDMEAWGYPWVTSNGATHATSVGAIFRNSDADMCASSICHAPGPPSGSNYDASEYYLEYFRPPTTSLCSTCHTGAESHDTHLGKSAKGVDLGCSVCHSNDTPHFSSLLFADGQSKELTTACNNCHSPGGYYDMVDCAKDNWAIRIYESDGKTLRAGNEEWCASCHDSLPANSKADNTGIDAPNIVGDQGEGDTYGYYVTGHKIVCTKCHDPSLSHIDHDHRTYTAASLNYQEGYRLRSVNGLAPLMVPRLTGGDPQSYSQYFALCFSCHNKHEILGTDKSAGSYYKSPLETNFYEEEESNRNGHILHLGFGNIHWDSDWDLVADSCENCTTCHNVHGSLTPAMIRHGELISTPGTQDKVPALNFYYYRPSDEVATATFDPALTVEEEGMYAVSAYWVDGSNRATNAPYTIHYYDTSTSTYVDETVRVDQKNIGKVWYRLGGEDKEYFLTTDSYIMLSNDNANNYVIADAIRLSKDGVDRDIDNLDAHVTYFPEGEWPVGTPSGSWGDNIQFHAKQEGIIDNDIAVSESIGGRMMMAGYHIDRNKVCGTCHGDVSYFRTPYLGPRFLDIGKDRVSITTDTESVCFKAGVLCNDTFTVRIDLLPIGGDNAQALFNDGTHCDSVIADYIYSYEETIQEALEDGHIWLTMTAATASLERTRQIRLAITDPAAIYVDNLDVVSEWLFVSSTEYTWDDSAQYHAGGGTGSNTFTFVPQIPVDGYYNIYSWWTAHDNRASDAPYTISYYDEITQIYETVIIEVNQQQNGNTWNYLGNYYLKAGTGNYLSISDAADDPTSFIIADAAKFVLGYPDLPFPYVDNLDASTSDVVGTWSFVGDTSNTWDNSAQFHAGGSGNNTFTFRPLIPTDGYYNIHAWWKAGSNRAPDTPYTIKYYNNVNDEYETETITVDQRRNYEGWYCFGNYYLKAGIENFVRLSDQATGYVIADAVWFEADDVPCPPNFYPIVDDLDLDVIEVVGTWTNVSNTDGTWNNNAKYHAAGSGGNTFMFRPQIVESGNYDVYTCWKAGTNRATDARYKIRYYNSGTSEYVETTVGSVNQQQTPDDLLYQGHWWEYLGQFYLEAGTGNYVKLTDEANGYVIADAVFFAKIN